MVDFKEMSVEEVCNWKSTYWETERNHIAYEKFGARLGYEETEFIKKLIQSDFSKYASYVLINKYVEWYGTLSNEDKQKIKTINGMFSFNLQYWGIKFIAKTRNKFIAEIDSVLS